MHVDWVRQYSLDGSTGSNSATKNSSEAGRGNEANNDGGSRGGNGDGDNG
jgi:hypothetical protein